MSALFILDGKAPPFRLFLSLQKKNVMNKFFYLTMLFFALTACQPPVYYQQEVKFENSNWIKFNDLNFDIPVEGGKTYSFEAIITCDSNYLKRKLKIGFYASLPSGEERLDDQEIRILDYEYHPLGIKTNGNYVIRKILKEKMLISETGILKLEIVHHSQYLNNYGLLSFNLLVSEE